MLSTVIVKTDRETDGSSAALYFTFLTKRSFSTRILAWIPPEVFKECPSFLFFPLTVWSVSRFLHRDHWNWDQVLRFLEKKLLRRPRPGCSGYFVEGDWVEKMPIYKQWNVINRRHVEETLHHNTSHGEDRICTNDQKTQCDRGTGFQHHQLRSRSTIQTSDTALVLGEPELCVCWRQEKLESCDRLSRVPLLIVFSWDKLLSSPLLITILALSLMEVLKHSKMRCTKHFNLFFCIRQENSLQLHFKVFLSCPFKCDNFT